METRKIQQVSNGTFTVSLPREWADGEGITAGTVVNLHTHIDGVLVVQAPEREDDASMQFTVTVGGGDAGGGRDSAAGDFLEQTLRAAYAAGSKQVVVEADGTFDAAQRQAVRRVARNLVGVTITEESDAAVTVRNVLDANEVSIRQSVRQLQFVAVSMHRDATAALTGAAPLDGFAERDDRADRLFAMVDRHFTRGLDRLDEIDALGETRPELFRLHTAARELERVADHAERIAAVASAVPASLPQGVADEVSELAELVPEALEAAVQVAFDGENPDAAREALSARDRVRAGVEDVERRLFEERDAEVDYRFAHALHALERTAEHVGNVAEVGLRTAVRTRNMDERPVGEGGRESAEHTQSA
ncbi:MULTISPECIES: PhoU domain-containing protein [unclassified Haloferax]|uniref:PhoU domain-containing protein n=1 Tax=unclassified Haloferax TaxID=2625095 RepID=UPI00287601CC|nr:MULTISPECIES: PhoU domain-containing protein [unclassified Haloferax]MDS0242472.1 phosphate uptake regulator PhoU [Haloferax sp. S2CR25]MDS0445593.1 phosphate uptake regulator PhoU [Haloferax sp. S2CR25-2]